jgi:DNA-binding NarL/FixJ family response regulator
VLAAASHPSRDVLALQHVLVVDDHDVVHWGVRTLLRRQTWVAEAWSARTGAEAVALAGRHRIDLALVDLFVGNESGPDICERLQLVRPGMRVLLISGAGIMTPRTAAGCGASGFITKDRPGADLVRAMRLVASGERVFDEDVGLAGVAARLTEREREVLGLLAAGHTNREIAARLHLSPFTVKDHASAVYRKLGVRGRMQAVRRAERLGLLP